MKKLVLYVLIVCGFQVALAQNFTIVPKLAKGQGPNSTFQIDAVSTFTNTGTETEFEWKIIEMNAPSGWEFSMCDPLNCVASLTVGSSGIFTLGVGKNGQFKGDFSPNGKSGIGTVKVIIYPKATPAAQDTLAYQMNAWVTGLKESSQNKEFAYFPNPVKDHLYIRYTTKEAMLIDIYNVLGTKVKSFTHSGFETDLNVGDLQNGIYFIRFRDGNQNISKHFTKTE